MDVYKSVDEDLRLFFQEIAVMNGGTTPQGYPEHMRIRDVMEREALFGQRSPHIPRQVKFNDGIMSLPGRELVYRLYRPFQSAAPAPGILFAHGGGWVAGSIYTHHALCAEVALRTSRVVVSLQYRRAPENPFPAGHEDLWDAWHWLYAHGDAIGLDPQSLALSGDSAGGHLALSCALRHRLDGGEMPAPDKLLLWYPNTDRRPETESRKDYAHGYGLNAERMEFFWRCLEGDDPQDPNNYVLYPGHVPPPGGLPPTVIITAEHDMLRDEAEQYAQRIKEAGNQITLLRAENMLHGFARLHRESAAANQWVRRGCLAFMQLPGRSVHR